MRGPPCRGRGTQQSGRRPRDRRCCRPFPTPTSRSPASSRARGEWGRELLLGEDDAVEIDDANQPHRAPAAPDRLVDECGRRDHRVRALAVRPHREGCIAVDLEVPLSRTVDRVEHPNAVPVAVMTYPRSVTSGVAGLKAPGCSATQRISPVARSTAAVRPNAGMTTTSRSASYDGSAHDQQAS